MALIISLAVIAAMAFLVVRARPTSPIKTQKRQQSTGTSHHFAYRAVSIHCGRHPCKAVRRVARSRFLVGKTPVLPLASCDCERCDCTYSHHPDRRDPGDRRGLQPFDLQMTARTDGPDHRHNRGRRRIDYA